MTLSSRDLAFVRQNRSAAMITVADDGMAKVARVGVAVVDGKIWSSGTQDRRRTARLRTTPRCTLYVYDDSFSWIALECDVTILEGAIVPELSVRLFRVMQDKPEGPLSWFGGELGDEAFMQAMVDEGRVIYELDVTRAYGMH
jgi:hypothetical protein